MADINEILRRYSGTVSDIGRSALHALYPKEFEYYLVSLELTVNDKTVDYFVFPIMPSAISKSENTRVNVKKTATANVVINSRYFVPHDITLKGNFGRGFNILLQPQEPISFKALRYSIKDGVWKGESILSSLKESFSQFNPAIKTGYGCIKILQAIIDKAKGVDENGNPFKLYFYNPALGESYLVVPTSNPLSLNQDENQNNMIWEYTLNLIAVADVTSSNRQNDTILRSLSNLVSVGAVQKAVNKVSRDASNFLLTRNLDGGLSNATSNSLSTVTSSGVKISRNR